MNSPWSIERLRQVNFTPRATVVCRSDGTRFQGVASTWPVDAGGFSLPAKCEGQGVCGDTRRRTGAASAHLTQPATQCERSKMQRTPVGRHTQTSGSNAPGVHVSRNVRGVAAPTGNR
jgi:hypothetical protein